MKPGRPTKYTEDMPQRLSAYFTEKEPFEIEIDESGKAKLKPNKLPTIERFAIEQGVHIDTIYEWASKHQIFSEALRMAVAAQKDMLIQGGLSGAYKDTIARLILSTNHKMSEKTETTVKGDPDNPINVNHTVCLSDETRRVLEDLTNA